MAKSDFINVEAAQNRFSELKEKHDAALALSAPLRAARDKFVQEGRVKEKAMNDEIKDAERGVFEMAMEMAELCNLLDGKTGVR